MKAFHAPGFVPEPGCWVALGDTGLRVPALAGPAVERVWETLEASAAAWRRRTMRERVARLAAVAAALRARGPGAWAAAMARSAGLSPAGLVAAWDATFAPCDEPALAGALQAEGLAAGIDPALVPRRLVHVLAGNVLPPTFAMLVRGWLLGAAQWLRPASRDPLFALGVVDALGDVAPELASCCAVLWWPRASRTEAAVLGSADVVTVQGDDASVDAVRAETARHAPRARTVGYGTRWSLGVVSQAAQTPATARALAWDVALFDQQGCLSPSLVLAEEGPHLAAFSAALAAALAALETRLPRGTPPPAARAALRLWRESMRLGVALGENRALWESPGTTAWAVVLGARCRFLDTPLDRHVPVVPFTTAAEITIALGERRQRLQGLAAALDGWAEARRRDLVAALGPARCAAPGTLQLAPPGWAQDHRPALGSLLLESWER